MAGNRIGKEVLFIWIYQTLLLELASQVQRCSGHVKSPELSVGELEYADIYNYKVGPSAIVDIKKIAQHTDDQMNDGRFTMGYDGHQLKGAYNEKDDKLFKRGAGERRSRAKIRRMMKRKRLFHQGRLGAKNVTTVEENNSAIENPKTFSKDASYAENIPIVREENTNNNYTKSSLMKDNKGYITKNVDLPRKGAFANISNVKGEELLTSEHKDLTGNDIYSKNMNIDETNENTSNNYTSRGLKKDAHIVKHKKGSFEKMKKLKEKNKYLRIKQGLISPIKTLLRKKIKNKIDSDQKFKNTNEVNDNECFANDIGEINLNRNIESGKIPTEGLSYGLEENLKNLSLINHGFLRAFEKKYFDNHFNETESQDIMKTKPTSSFGNNTAYADTLNSRSKPNDWKAWEGFNVGDYYEPLLFLKDKEHFDSTSPIINQNSMPKDDVQELTGMSAKYSKNKKHQSDSLNQQEERNKLSISKTNNGKGLHDKKKRYMYSGKSKHKVHAKPVDSIKIRGARDTRNYNHKSKMDSSSRFDNDNDSFDYEENKADDDEIFNSKKNVGSSRLMFQEPEKTDRYLQTFNRLKKDDGYFKRSRSNKLKNKVETNGFHNEKQLRALNSRKSFDSSYNGDEHESTETCVGYKSEDVYNTTDMTTTIVIQTTATTKRNNNGKSKIFAKSKKMNVETKTNTNHSDEIDEHSLFLCGQLADDFVKAVFAKIRRSKKILKELGFNNDTDQSCDRCIETKASKLPDVEIMKSTLGKCSNRDFKHMNSKCYAVPDPMESFLLMLLSSGKEEEDSVHNRLRDDSSFIFNGDDFESLTKIDNGAAINEKYSDDRESVNKATFEKQDLREESDEEKPEDKGSKRHPTILEDNIQEDTSKEAKRFHSNDEDSNSKSKKTKVLEPKRSQQDAGEQPIFQSEETLRGNDLIDVFEGHDSPSSVRHKYPSYNYIDNGKGNQIMKNINNKIISHDSNIEYNNEENTNGCSGSQLFEREKFDYLNEPRNEGFEQNKKQMQRNMIAQKQEKYIGDDPQRRMDLNAHENGDRYSETVNRYDKTYKYLGNTPSKLIQSKTLTQNSKKCPNGHLSCSAVGSDMGEMEYQLYPDQSKEPGNDISYNALPFYDDNLRMGKRETPSDGNEEDVIFFELPDIEYDLY